MDRTIDILMNFPPFLREYDEIKEFAKAVNPELQRVNDEVKIDVDNTYIMTADEDGLSRQEHIEGIYPEEGASIEVRRMQALNRMNDKLPYTIRTLKQLLDSVYGEGSTRIERIEAERVLNVYLYSALVQGIDIKSTVQAIIPANMILNVINSNVVEVTSNVYAGSYLGGVEHVKVVLE